MLIIHFKSYGYLICLILSQANICFKREPSVWAIIHKEKLRPWRCSSEYKQPQVVCVKQCQNQHSVVFIISALLIRDFQLELKKEASYPSLILLCSQAPAVSPEHCPWEDQAAVDSTTTLLHTHDTRDSSRMEGAVQT